MDVGASFGAWVKLRRRTLRLTQAELAQQVGCSSELIRKIEADARRPSTSIAERLARFLGLPDHQHAVFVKVARAELRTDWLPNFDRVVASPQIAVPPQRHTALPTPLTPLIGRARELHDLGAMLMRTEVRLLTLTGAPGIGKTRLGLQSAAAMSDSFADGVCFVALAPVSDPAFVASAIAQALGVQERPERSALDTLKEYLRERQLLLVLDNFEHLLAAAPLVADLLMAAPTTKALVTSRAVLRISGEHEFAVSPLALPDLNALPTSDTLAGYAAIDLFVQRAHATASNFVLTEENAPAVAGICVQLDGLPLAIELAAARIKLFPPKALLDRLERRLAFLTTGPRDLPIRQQTLRNLIGWSHDLLTADEKIVFRRLGVFVGGCALEAAETVCGDREFGIRVRGSGETAPSPEPRTPIPMLDGLTTLVDHHLVQQTGGPDGAPRLMMLETLREYATERLEESGEAEEMRRRHAEYYLALVEMAEPAFRSPQARACMERLATEYDNIRAALAWSQATADQAELGLRLAGALWWFWDQHSWVEGDRWLTHVLAQPTATSKTRARAKALLVAGFFAEGQRGAGSALPLIREALALARELEDRTTTAWALIQLGHLLSFDSDKSSWEPLFAEAMVLFEALDARIGIARALFLFGIALCARGEIVRSSTLLEQSQALHHDLGDKSGESDTLWALGLISLDSGDTRRAAVRFMDGLALGREAADRWAIANALCLLGVAKCKQGDLDRAASFFIESLARWRELQARSDAALTLYYLGHVALLRRDYQRAATYYNESLTVYQQLGDKRQIALLHCSTAYLAHKQGEHIQAVALFAESLSLSCEYAVHEGITTSLLGTSLVALALGQAVRAARLVSAVMQAYPTQTAGLIGAPLEIAGRYMALFGQREVDQTVADLRASLGEAAFAAAWAGGQAMSTEQAIADALQLDAELARVRSVAS